MEFNPMHSFHSPDPIHNLEIRVLLRRVGVTDRAGASRAAKRAKEGDASKSKKSKSEKTKKTKTKKKRKKKKQQQQQRDGSDDDAEGDAEAEADSDDGESGDDESSDDESSSGSAFPDDDEPKKKKSRGAGLVPPGQVYMRTFKWQEKAFSPWELMRYHSMCRADNLAETGRILPESATGNNEEYREEMDEWLKEGLDPLSLLQPAMLFSYVDNDGFIPESERDEVATFSAPPLLIAEQVTPMEHYRAKMRRGFADEQTNRALHADRGMLSQTMYIMAAIEVDPDGFKRTAEDDAVQQPLCMIRAFPSSTRVDMQPRFSPSPIVIPNAALAVAAATKAAAGGGGAADGDAAAAAQESARMEWYRFSTARGVYEYRIENVSGPTEGAYPRFVRPAQAALLPAGEGGEADEAAKEEAAEAAEAVAKAAGEERATGLVDLLHYNEAQVRSDVEREKQLRTLSSLLDEEDERRDREATASMIARTAASFKGPVHSNEVHVHCLVELMEGSGFPGNCERLCVFIFRILSPLPLPLLLSLSLTSGDDLTSSPSNVLSLSLSLSFFLPPFLQLRNGRNCAATYWMVMASHLRRAERIARNSFRTRGSDEAWMHARR